MSTIVGNVVLRAQESQPDLVGHVIASALAVICGCIIVAIGLARLGWIVDLISLTAITAFMTVSIVSSVDDFSPPHSSQRFKSAIKLA